MTIIRVRFSPGDIRPVDVRECKCPTFGCFYPSKHTIRSAAGMSGASSRSTDDWECGTRERQGCPPEGANVYRQETEWRKVRGAWQQRHERGA